MIKYLLLLMVTLGAAGSAHAQNKIAPAPGLPADSLGRIQFAGVVAVPGVSAAELQARAREWIALTFEDAHQVTQLDDAARGVLVGRGFTVAWPEANKKRIGDPLSLFFTFRLDFRDGRYRYLVRELGAQLAPSAPVASSLNGAPVVASRQAYEAAAWQLGGTATVAASPRQTLLQPDYSPSSDDYNVVVRFGNRWPAFGQAIDKSVLQLLEALRRHETMAPAKW